MLIALSQIKVLIGAPKLGEETEGAGLLRDVWNTIDYVNPYVIGIAGITFATAAFVKYFLPKWPNYLVGMTVGSITAWIMDAADHDVAFVEPISSALPTFHMPNLSLSAIQSLSQGAFAISLIGILEAVSISRALAKKSGQRVDSKQEIIGQGLSNLIGSMFSSYAGSGSFTRSGLNYDAGAKTPLAAILASIFLLVIVSSLISLISYLPVPAIAGLIILIAWRLVDFRQIRHIFQTSAAESLILCFTILAVLVANLELAIFGGIILSLGIFLRRTMRTDVPIWAPHQASQHRSFISSERSGVRECPQAVFARLQGPLYFGAMDGLKDTFRKIEEERPGQKHLVLGVDGSIGMDFSGAEFLAEESQRRRARGGGLYLVVKYPRLREQVLRYGLSRDLGSGHIFRRKSEAIPRLIRKLDASVCEGCTARIFLECPPGKPSSVEVSPDTNAG